MNEHIQDSREAVGGIGRPPAKGDWDRHTTWGRIETINVIMCQNHERK